MKVLLLIPYSPLKPAFGGALRIYHMLKLLCSQYDVTVAGFGSAADREMMIKHFPQLAGKLYLVEKPENMFYRRGLLIRSLFSRHSHWYWMTRSKKLQHILDTLTSREQFDIIQSEFPVMAMFGIRGGTVRILDAHNVEFHNFKRMSKIRNALKSIYYHLEYRKFFKEEMDAAAKQDAIFTTSTQDLELFDHYLPNVPKFVIPNGVDVEYCKPAGAETEPATMVFVGMMKYIPNHDGITWFLDEIFPLIRKKIPHCKVYIVGKDPHPAILKKADENIIVPGFLEDIRPVIQKAAVYIVPLRMGGGTRLKILEAMAMKKPLVTTRIGCEGIDICHNYNALVANSPETFADSVIELFHNRTLRDTLVENGYRIAHEKYSWQVIGENLYNTLNRLPGRQPSAGFPELQTEQNGVLELQKR